MNMLSKSFLAQLHWNSNLKKLILVVRSWEETSIVPGTLHV